MTDISGGIKSYGPGAFFAIALVFVAAAPFFWLQTEAQPGDIDAAYENADLYQEILPAFNYGFGRIRNGQLPLWNPKQLCGVPFQANPASALFHPLNLLFAGFPVQRAMAVHAFAALSLGGILFVLFMRSLNVGYVAGVIGAIAYAFSGASAAVASRPGLANALALAPLVFWGLRHHARTQRLAPAMAAGIGGALLILAGANGMTLAFLVVSFMYGLYLVAFPGPPAEPQQERPPALRRAEILILIFTIAAAVSAVQSLPSLFWMATLEHPWRALMPPDLPGVVPNAFAEMLAQLFVPKPGALPRLGYLGALALLAIPAAFFNRKSRSDAVFFAIAATAGLALAAGCMQWLPPSIPVAYLAFPAVFSLAALASMGFDHLLAAGSRHRARRPWMAAAAVVLTGAALFYVAPVAPRGRIVVFILLLAPLLVSRARWVLTTVGIAYALLLFADLSAASRNRYRHPAETDFPIRQYMKTIHAAEEQALDARVVVSSRLADFALPGNLAMLYPFLYAADGLIPLSREQAIWWRRLGPPERPTAEDAPKFVGISSEALNPRLLNLMCARVVLAGPESLMYSGQWQHEGPPLHEVKTEDLVRLFINDQAMPRVYWAGAWRMAEGVPAAIEHLTTPEFNPRTQCLVDHDSPGYAALASLVLPGQAVPPVPPQSQCTIEQDEPERVVVRVVATQPGVVVLADTYDRGWKAAIDGADCPLLRVNGLFRGVATPAGEHVIVYRYRPASYYTGLAISLAALGALTLSALFVFFRRPANET